MRRLALTAWLLLVTPASPRVGADTPKDAYASRSDSRAVIQRFDDWPMWGRAPVRTFHTAAKGPPLEWDVGQKQNIRWTAALGSTTYSTPAVCNGVLYVGTNNDPGPDAGVLMALRALDGKMLWKRLSTKLPSGRVNDWPMQGIASTPAVERETSRLWYCTNRCEVVCLDVSDSAHGSSVIWSLDMMKDLDVFPHNMTCCSPLVWDEFVYVVTANGVSDDHKSVPHPDAPAIVCLDKNTGKIIWKDNSPGKNILHSQWANPTLAQVNGRALVIAPLGDAWVYAFDARSGEIVWKFDANPKAGVYPGTRNEILGTPVIFNQRMYLANGQDPEHGEGYGMLWCVDITGRGDVSAEVGPIGQPGMPNSNSRVVWQFDQFDFDHDGKIQRSEHMNRTISSAAIDPDTHLLFIPDFSGFVHCFDTETGQIYWTHDLESGIWSTPLVCDGKVFVADEEGDVLVFAASRQKRILAKNETLNSRCHCSPIFANGVLYLTYHDMLVAVQNPRSR